MNMALSRSVLAALSFTALIAVDVSHADATTESIQMNRSS